MPESYIVKHKNESVRANSRSGGVFTAFSDEVLQRGGVVYGCVLNNKFKAVHIRADNEADRDLMRKSKYIQSDMGNCFEKVKDDLKSGKQVLFSGTSCQIAGLKKFCSDVDNTNLLCIDIVCHGVPSPEIWSQYLNEFSRKKSEKIETIEFRNKDMFGWKAHKETLKTDKKVYVSKEYRDIFLSNYATRPSCFTCPYRTLIRSGDITIADAWGVDNADADFNDNKGISLILINSTKGKTMFNKCSDELIIRNVDIDLYMQQALMENYKVPQRRSRFWKDVYAMEPKNWLKKYKREFFIQRIVEKILSKIK